ncbi:Tryprostatin B 6-hydroxylase [Cladorrhinum sp. PSN332]|nr:Tryprostatin B 6-hydroxylase [Cladorrhinum sp. PSN332]
MDLLVLPSWVAARDDLTRACAVAAITGFLSHVLYFVRGYRDMQAFGILIGHSLAYAGLTTAITTQTGISRGFLISTAVFATYLFSLFTSIIIYRLFFHPLRHFPGPFAAKCTRFYGPWQARNGQLHLEQEKLFKIYGNIVRVAPNELYIVSSDAIDKIHASKSKCRKKDAGVYNALESKGQYNLDGILTREEHRWRRQVWERAMSSKQLAIYEDRTRQVCHTWLDTLKSLNGTPINTTLYSNLLTFDHMGKIGFSHEFSTLQEGKHNDMLDYLQQMFGPMGRLGELIWPLAILKGLGLKGLEAEFDRLAQEMADRQCCLLISPLSQDEKNHTNDMIGHFIEDFRSEKPTAFFNKHLIYLDSAMILLAATDTIGLVLSQFFYHLSANPSYQSTLLSLVTPLYGLTIPGEFTSADLATIPLIDAIINETLRLDNPVANNAARLTPPEGIVVGDGTYIPGGVAVRVPGYVMHRSEQAFEMADKFIPGMFSPRETYIHIYIYHTDCRTERWTTSPQLVKDPKAFFPFLTGPNNCVGKRLAMNVLRLVIAYTVMNYRFEHAPGEDGTDVYAKMRDNLVLKPGPLMLVFVKR